MTPFLLALAPLCLASTQASAPALSAPSAPTLERVVILGASLSAGFGAQRTFVDVFQAALRAPPERPVVGLGNVLFFTSPLAIGEDQIAAALDLEPTLVVAVDFLFWFGYGSSNAEGGPITAESQRLELLERGLELLTELECPLVLGDFPDMSAAVGTMLAPAQMPARTTLPLLSRRVREWAAARPATILLSLSELVPQLASKEEIRIGRHRFAAGSRLLQDDHLHPTVQGLVLLAQLTGDELVAKQLVRPTAFQPEFEAVVEALGLGRARPAEDAATPRR